MSLILDINIRAATHFEPIEVFTSLDEVISLPPGDWQVNDGFRFEARLLHQQIHVVDNEAIPFLNL